MLPNGLMFYLCYIHFVHVLFSGWPTFCSISHSWYNRLLVIFFLRSCWYALITKYSRGKSPLQFTTLGLAILSSPKLQQGNHP